MQVTNDSPRIEYRSIVSAQVFHLSLRVALRQKSHEGSVLSDAKIDFDDRPIDIGKSWYARGVTGVERRTERERKEPCEQRERGIENEKGRTSSTAIRFICRNWGSFNAPNQTPVMAAINLPTIT